VAAALLVPLAVFGASAFAHSASAVQQNGRAGAAQYQYKVPICHRTHSKKHPWQLITISSRAVPAHLRHGDQMPPCPTTSATAKKNGKPSKSSQRSHDSQKQDQSKKNDQSDQAEHGNGKDNGHHGKP